MHLVTNPKVHKNAVASPKVYEFSNLSLCVFVDLKKIKKN